MLAYVPSKLSQVIECPPISQLVKAGAAIASIEACLAIEITKASNALTVGGNLRQGQSLEIAKELIVDYPHESIEDFCYCLRNGVKGKYTEQGKLFRFDKMVISEWFTKYLDEKYQAIEDKLMNEKDQEYQSRTKGDWLELMQDALKVTEVPKLQSVPKLTDKEIEAEGKRKPKKQSYPCTSRNEIIKRALHLQWIAENFDPRTGDKLETWIDEQTWLEKQ